MKSDASRNDAVSTILLSKWERKLDYDTLFRHASVTHGSILVRIRGIPNIRIKSIIFLFCSNIGTQYKGHVLIGVPGLVQVWTPLRSPRLYIPSMILGFEVTKELLATVKVLPASQTIGEVASTILQEIILRGSLRMDIPSCIVGTVVPIVLLGMTVREWRRSVLRLRRSPLQLVDLRLETL